MCGAKVKIERKELPKAAKSDTTEYEFGVYSDKPCNQPRQRTAIWSAIESALVWAGCTSLARHAEEARRRGKQGKRTLARERSVSIGFLIALSDRL